MDDELELKKQKIYDVSTEQEVVLVWLRGNYSWII